MFGITAKNIFAVVGTALTYVFGGFDKMMLTILCFMLFDYLTGVLAAYYTKSVSSKAGFEGIVKKVAQLFLIGVATLLDGLIGLDQPYIRTVIIMWLIGNEGISILENLAKMNIIVPKFLRVALEQIRDKEGVK